WCTWTTRTKPCREPSLRWWRWRPQSTPRPWRSSPPRHGLPIGHQATAIASSTSALPPLRPVKARQKKHHGRHTRACMDVKIQQ
ncbi:unnamed protein product, partial [Ectocarpus sp. 8 AP-2014]